MKVVLALILLINSSFVLADTKRSCPQPVPNPGVQSLDQFSAELRDNNISILQGNTVQPANVDLFLQHYRKFPAPLRSEMVQRRARIVIMEGEGVKTDPSFTAEQTWDGRDWSKVPGSGGIVSRHHNIPTRIVVSSLYHNHGSSDLLLHEHAHTLDSLYGQHGVSKSATWTNLMAAAPAHLDFAKMLCGTYCSEHSEEAFAELFAYYYNCPATKTHMEESAPQLADFFKNLTSVDDLLKGRQQRAVASVPSPAAVVGEPQPVNLPVPEPEKDCEPTSVSDLTEKLKPLTNLTPYLQNYPTGKGPSYFPVKSPVYPTRNTGVSAQGIK